MAQAKYLDAAQDLRCLQGIGDFASLENPRLASKDFATAIGEGYNLNSLKRARQILDTEQDMQTVNENDPIGTTLNYGEMTKEWLEREAKKETPIKHEMVIPEKEEKEEPTGLSKDELSALGAEIEKFLGKKLPEDPNVRLLMWQELNELQKSLKALEMAMRKQMAAEFFKAPTEGTNTHDMGNDWKLKLKHTLNRKPDEACFEAVFAELNEEGSTLAKEDFFKFKPELIKSEYNKLTDKQRPIFDQCLITKPGSPELTIVPPKEKA